MYKENELFDYLYLITSTGALEIHKIYLNENKTELVGILYDKNKQVAFITFEVVKNSVYASDVEGNLIHIDIS
jgi:hypothetical protein